MEKLIYTIGEAAEILGESISLVRYWSNQFPKHLKPRRNAKGNRQYFAEDIEVLKKIHYLVKVKGMTLEGADMALSSDKSPVDKKVKALDSLKAIREQLVEVRKSL